MKFLNNLHERYINISLDVNDWKDALVKGSDILKIDNIIESRYVDEMINSVEKFGPYIVISPGVALGHARPEHGAIKQGITISTLKKPIKFGHKTNDPVKLLIIIVSTNSENHIEMLRDISMLLSNTEILEGIINSKTKDELKSYLVN